MQRETGWYAPEGTRQPAPTLWRPGDRCRSHLLISHDWSEAATAGVGGACDALMPRLDPELMTAAVNRQRRSQGSHNDADTAIPLGEVATTGRAQGSAAPSAPVLKGDRGIRDRQP